MYFDGYKILGLYMCIYTNLSLSRYIYGLLAYMFFRDKVSLKVFISFYFLSIWCCQGLLDLTGGRTQAIIKVMRDGCKYR